MSSTISTEIKPVKRREQNVSKLILYHVQEFFKRLIARKSMVQLQADIETQNELRRALKWYELTAIGLGGMIGAGIFVLSGEAAAQYAGPSVIISFIIAGFIALLAALSFSELAAMMPVSGAVYTYTYTALGEYAAWFIGWNYALLYQLGASAVVANWSRQLVQFIEYVSDYKVVGAIVEAPIAWNSSSQSFYTTGQVINLPAVGITIVITLILLSGIRPTSMVNLVLVIFKILIILIIIFACCAHVDRDNYKPFFPPNQGSFKKFGFTGMLQACTTVFFAYIGFDSIAAVAQEAKTPIVKSVSIGLILSVVISFLLYIGMCTIMVGLIHYDQLQNTAAPFIEALHYTPYGQWIYILVYLGTIAALTTVSLTMILSQTRVFYAMALDGLLPECFATRDPRTKIPWISTIISGSFCAVCSATLPADIADQAASISALITYIFVHIDVVVMHYTHDDTPRTSFRVPFGPLLIPVVGAILCALLLNGIQKYIGFAYLVWTGIGQFFYFAYGYRHSKRRELQRNDSVRSSHALISTVESIVLEQAYHRSHPSISNEVEEIEMNNILEYL